MFEVDRIDHVALRVADPEVSIAWYRKQLGFRRLHEGLWDGPPFMIGNDHACLALFPGTDVGAGMSGAYQCRLREPNMYVFGLGAAMGSQAA